MLKFLPATWAVCLLAACVPETNEPRRIDPELQKLLTYYDGLYDPGAQMLRLPFASPGYHTQVASGAMTHPTRESLTYALALLQRGRDRDEVRAAGIIRRVISLQDTRPDSGTYGTWPWLLEEPLEQMQSPDQNWADFCGMSLAHMLVKHHEQLPDDLCQAMRASLLHAARSIRSRDVGPGYTNIAVLGGGVCAVAGELLGDDQLLEYGRRRLQAVVRHTEENGSFSEYNSPPYVKVVIAECERTLQLVDDPETREAAESIRRAAWQIAADSFHPLTAQWAGPHARTSRDRLRASTVDFLSRRLPIQLEPHPTMAAGAPRGYAVVRPIPCPDELTVRFKRPVESPLQLKRIFERRTPAIDSTIGTTWHSSEATLGSVNRSSFWTQRKPLIGYWRTKPDRAVVCRLRFLRDGRDFASMGVRTAQEGPRAISIIHPMTNRGDWHRTLDRPRDGVFYASDFRLRFELRGVGVSASEIDEGRYSLSADDFRVVIHALPGRFAGQPIQWRIGGESDSVFVDGVCYEGERRAFDFDKSIEVELAAGIELLRIDQPVADRSPSLQRHSTALAEATWQISDGVFLSVEVQNSNP